MGKYILTVCFIILLLACIALSGLIGLVWQMTQKEAPRPATAIYADSINVNQPPDSASPPAKTPSTRYQLPNRNLHFTGREEILKNINQTFNFIL